MTAPVSEHKKPAFQGTSVAFLGRHPLHSELEAGLPHTPIRGLERERAAAALGIHSSKVASVKQVHSASIVEVDSRYTTDRIPPDEALGEADALITNVPGVALLIKTADCLPILISTHSNNRSTHWIGAVHAGWRGLAGGILENTLDAILYKVQRAGLSVVDIGMTLGPAISGDVYEVGPEVAERFSAKTSGQGDRWLLNLPANAISAAVNFLTAKENAAYRAHAQETALTALTGAEPLVQGQVDGLTFRLHVTAAEFNCTYTRNDLYFSHRKGDTGRNVSAIMIREGELGHR
ncbi:MAG: laccase domain-containing protein [Spirochaetia bacterium]|nr:laccase domain-containing protein [Spirochaetia bacterium]